MAGDERGTGALIRPLLPPEKSVMNDSFEQKVRAAAIAGWWVILIGYALLTLTWVVYIILVSARPKWIAFGMPGVLAWE
jgi:hypothetical protein